MRFVFYLIFLLVFNSASICASSDCKRVVIMGGGVTGTFAAAKIAANLKSSDELWIIEPPEQDTIKDLGEGVLSNYTASAFTPIGIQTEVGALHHGSLTAADIENAKKLQQIDIKSKLYVSRDLDDLTQTKLNRYALEDKKINKSLILMHYHRDVCYKEWQKYLEVGGEGVDFKGTVILTENVQALQNIREKILNNRMLAGYPAEDSTIRILNTKETSTLLPRYSQIIETKELHGLFGLSYDGRVTGTNVMKTLNAQIEQGPAKIVRVNGFVTGLQLKNEPQGFVVTGVKLKNGEIVDADVVVSALGQGVEEVLKSVDLNLPILKKWGAAYSLPQDQLAHHDEPPTIIMRGLGIVRDLPGFAINCGLGEWILPEGVQPNAKHVKNFVEESVMLWENIPFSQKRIINNPIYVQPRPMTLDGLPVLDSSTQGLVILNPSGSLGNTQGPGSALFAANKVLEQLKREIPDDLRLTNTVDWKYFELYSDRFN